MSKCWLRVILQGLMLLRALLAAEDLTTRHPDMVGRGNKKYDDRCNSTNECGFMGSVCVTVGRCHCSSEYPITNHVDKCGKPARVNESCTFTEQCEYWNPVTNCRDGLCMCKFDRQPIIHPDGKSECIVIENTANTEFVAPTMIGILVAMAVMFIIICIVFRLFSNARWGENRTIFNTPNPRLMNVSLLRDSKILHQERRSSRGSIRGPSRPPSVPSLAPNSPVLGSKGRRGSTDSPRSNKSSPGHINSGSAATSPMLESVTVEVRNP